MWLSSSSPFSLQPDSEQFLGFMFRCV